MRSRWPGPAGFRCPPGGRRRASDPRDPEAASRLAITRAQRRCSGFPACRLSHGAPDDRSAWECPRRRSRCPLEEAEGRGWSISPEPMSDSAIRCLHPSCTGLHRRRRDGASIAGSRRWSPIRRSGHAISRSARSSRTRSSPPCSRRPQVSPARGVRPMPPPSSAICRLALPSADSQSLARRALRAADYCFESGDTARARELLEQAVTSTSPGGARSDALLRVACVRHYEHDREGAQAVLEEALAEAGEDPELRAWVHSVCARPGLVERCRQGSKSRARGRTARPGLGGRRAPVPGSHRRRDVRDLRGQRPAGRRPRRALELDDPGLAHTGATAVAPVDQLLFALIFVEELETARVRLEEMLVRAREGGDDGSLPELLFWLGEARVPSWQLRPR